MLLKSFRSNTVELSGALGDLGTLLPLAVGLITLNHMSATSVFLVTGLTYIMCGAFYRLPIPVQPLKAVAAIAIATGLSGGVVAAAGLVMAAILFLLAVTGAIGKVSRLFPLPIVRGIQLGVGLLLVKAGLSLVTNRQVLMGGDEAVMGFAHLSVPMGLILAMALGLILFVFVRKRLPASLLVLALGVGAGLFWGSYFALQDIRIGLSLPAVSLPTVSDMSAALFLLVIPQIPLTLGNAVFATASTARTYFGDAAQRVTHQSLLTTMGIGNLAAGVLGGLPVCHGSGGLTAHYRLGARTGRGILTLGVTLALLALVVDGNLLPILSLVPYSVLGVFVIFAGIQHGLLVRDMRGAKDIGVVLLVAVSALATGNLAIGFASGIALNLCLSVAVKRRTPRIATLREETTAGGAVRPPTVLWPRQGLGVDGC